MPKTTHLNLELTNDNQTTFLEYREMLNGVGEGENKSNAQLVDDFAGKFAGGTSGQYLGKSGDGNFALEWKTPDSIPTKDSEELLQSGGAYDAIQAADTGSRIVVSDSGAVAKTLKPDKFYSFIGELTSLTITLETAAEGRENEYKGQFLTGSTAPTVTFPEGISWVGGEPSIKANKKYQFSILDNIGVIVGG